MSRTPRRMELTCAFMSCSLHCGCVRAGHPGQGPAVTSARVGRSIGMPGSDGGMRPRVEQDWLSERFAEHQSRLHAVAHRMLGSPSEAEHAVQEAWLRVGPEAGNRGRAGWEWGPGVRTAWGRAARQPPRRTRPGR
ncbi:sigma factor [Embleya sp. NBC_00896]|uniref:sigma factor n=1 Tax=Embleya sp. NBC_00896 TaxID=2975961 RepID=UPI00386F9649